MRLAAYGPPGMQRAALRVDSSLVDAESAAGRAGIVGAERWRDTMHVLAADAADRDRAVRAARTLVEEGTVLDDDVCLGPPVPRPDKILCIGHNYREHVAETQRDEPTVPVVFAKFRNCLRGAHDEIPHPGITNEIDYEGELALVIGTSLKGATAADAMDAVAGYMVFNDLSARDLQRSASQWTPGKALDGFAPCGPELVTADEVPDPGALRLTTTVNGERRQDASTAEMIFSVGEILEYLSSVMTLSPGDIVATGTPSGVGMGQDPKRFLQPGDVVEVSIGGLGATSNRIGPRPELAHA
jgi:acylpyruvate hydrolase